MIKYLFFFFLFFSVSTCTQYWSQEEPVNKHYEKEKAKREKNAKKAEKELLEEHEKIQTKNTRKMMKANKKKSKRLKSGKHPEPFYKKWFIKKN
jgi:Skp family chaperone for outer membrane proteins